MYTLAYMYLYYIIYNLNKSIYANLNMFSIFFFFVNRLIFTSIANVEIIKHIFTYIKYTRTTKCVLVTIAARDAKILLSFQNNYAAYKRAFEVHYGVHTYMDRFNHNGLLAFPSLYLLTARL